VSRCSKESEKRVPWFAIRTVYHFSVKSTGKNAFEERVVCFEASTWEQARMRAKAESKYYEAENNVIAHPEQSGYQQDGESLVDGYEVWSERYGKYEYHPEPPDA
jgi:hypothetical protein